MKIIDEALPEGFEIARFAKPMTREAELAPNERRLVVDVILRPKQPRRWEVEECDASVRDFVDEGSLGRPDLHVRIVREVLPLTTSDKVTSGDS